MAMPRHIPMSSLQWCRAPPADWAATRLAIAIERVAEALLVEDETQHHIMPAHELLRPRP